LASWFRRESKKIRTGPGGSKKLVTPLALALLKKTRPSGKRAHQPVEIFQKRNSAKIRKALTERGFDSINEASRVAERNEDEQETLEEQEEHVKAARSERMRLRTGVVSEMWLNASVEERAEARRAVEMEKEEMRRLQAEAEMLARADQPKLSLEQLQL
jgi:hypothetical protein